MLTKKGEEKGILGIGSGICKGGASLVWLGFQVDRECQEMGQSPNQFGSVESISP